VKLATIGTSKITHSFLEAVKQSGRFSYEAAYSRTIEKAKSFAEAHGAGRWFASIDELAKSEDIDAVYVASPNGLHFQQVRTLLAGGKHVICEKPIFMTLKEFDEAFRLAEEKGVYLFEAIRNIQTPVFKKLAEQLPKAGRVRSAVIQQIQYSSRYDAFLEGHVTNIFSAKYAGGALEDIGVYPLYAAISLFGKPSGVNYYPVMLSSGVDGSGTLVLTYPDFVCTILCSKIAYSPAPSEIHGEKGTLRINSAADISRLEWIDVHTKEQVLLAESPSDNDKFYEIGHFADILEQQDEDEYLHLKTLSRQVLAAMEEARRQNGIRFPNDLQ
jgi:predicted dehydrogenase